MHPQPLKVGEAAQLNREMCQHVPCQHQALQAWQLCDVCWQLWQLVACEGQLLQAGELKHTVWQLRQLTVRQVLYRQVMSVLWEQRKRGMCRVHRYTPMDVCHMLIERTESPGNVWVLLLSGNNKRVRTRRSVLCAIASLISSSLSVIIALRRCKPRLPASPVELGDGLCSHPEAGAAILLLLLRPLQACPLWAAAESICFSYESQMC